MDSIVHDEWNEMEALYELDTESLPQTIVEKKRRDCVIFHFQYTIWNGSCH